MLTLFLLLDEARDFGIGLKQGGFSHGTPPNELSTPKVRETRHSN
jgi:hypothetical protein